MALPLLLPAAKGLLSAGVKAGAKKALMGKAKSIASNKAKKFLSDRKDRKNRRGTATQQSSTSKGGALVKAMSGGGVSAMVKSSAPVRVKKPNQESTAGKIGFDKINTQLENINKLSGSIDDALKGQYKKELEERKNKKEAAAKLRRSSREQSLESGKKVGSVASGVISSASKAFDFMGFISNILIGGPLLFLLKSFKSIVRAFTTLRKNAYLVFASLRAMLQTFKLAGTGLKTFVKGAIKAPLKIVSAGFKGFFKLFSSVLRKGGSLIGAGLRVLGNALFDFGAAALKRIKDLAAITGRGLVRGARAAKELANFLRKTAPLSRLRSAGGKLFQKAIVSPLGRLASKISYTRLGNKAAEFIFDARLGIRSAKKAAAPTLTKGKDLLRVGAAGGRKLLTEGGELLAKGADKGRRVASAVRGKVSPFLKKLLGGKGAQEVAGAAPFLKRLKGPLSKVKIPILGPLLVLGVNLLDPDVSVGESIFKALGTAVGEIIGTLIPIPILGTLIGGMLGEYGGSLLYTLLMGGGVKAFQKRISDDFTKALDMGKQGWEFLSGGAKRLIDNFPEKKIPAGGGLQTTLGLMFPLIGPLQGKGLGARIESLPDLGAFFDMEKMGNLLKSSFFPDDFKMPSPTTTTTPEIDLDALTPEEEALIEAQGAIRGDEDLIPDRITPIAAPNISGNDADLFQRLVLAESQSEGKLGMALVARSVMNRLGLIQSGTRSPGYFMANDDTLRGVIYGRNQYQPTRDGSIDRAYSAAQKQSAQAAINLAKDPDALRSALIGAGVSEQQARLLLGATGFRTGAAFNDESQNVNVVKFKNHLFNTAGNEGLKAVQPVRDSGMSTVTSTATTPMVGENKSPQETDGSTSVTGSGLKDIVPTENLQSIGAGSGDVGMTSGRGMRESPTTGGMKMHRGVDIGTSGQKGYFVAFKLKGVVSDTGTYSGYGKTVVLTCGDKDFLFAHLAQITVQKGKQYNGEIIGEIGNTGAGTGEHLHFEVSPAGTGGYQQDQDPMPFVKYLMIGKLGDGSAMGTQTAPSTTFSQVTESAIRPASPGSTAPVASRNLEQYPSYDDSQTNIIMMSGDQGSKGVMGALPSRSERPMIRMSASTNDMLNSYYKKQLLGLLYKVG